MDYQKYYAGIGSRETPIEFCKLFTKVASYLEQQGYTLRSGHADGADIAFENGTSVKEIYIPWKGFNGSTDGIVNNLPESFDMAKRFHPAWNRLSDGAKKLMARNCCQIFGAELNSNVDFVICWTPGGSGSGGTGQALRIASKYEIPVFDAGYYPTANDARFGLYVFLNQWL